CFQGSHVPLTF
nr:immunoglobulin light chain junction region [Mus musculus]NSM00084.1 immunoglobulin light chain junction region [Mus musculus]